MKELKKEVFMSFYINNTNPNRPGPICGNPMNGICEKALIEVTKVFDACVRLETITGLILTATDFTPTSPTLPLTFISAETDTTVPTTLTNVVIDRIESKPNYAYVSATINIPVIINYRDANGVLGTARSTYTTTQNVMMFVPQPSLAPVNVKAIGTFSSTIGTFTEPATFTLTACIQIVLKVTAEVDILVPSYGYPHIPPCQSAPEASCPGLGEMPLYPTAVCPGTITN